MKVILEINVPDEEGKELQRHLAHVLHILTERDELGHMSQYFKIFKALLKTGSLKGIKNGSANIHFDSSGNFARIRHDYEPWRELAV